MSGESEKGDATLDQAARRWVRQLVAGDATTADAEALARWRGLSPAHDAAFVSAARDWKLLGDSGRTYLGRQSDTRDAAPGAMRRAITTRRALIGGAAALAASGAAVAVLRPPMHLWPSLEELGADYRTATGEQKRVTLTDVAIQLNTQTSIKVTETANEPRSVRLIAGEASFALEQAARPLTVLAGAGRTTASRARFDIRSTGGRVCVTCVDGQVDLAIGPQSLQLAAGRQLTYDADGVQAPVAIDATEVTSWQDGFIVFRATALSDAVAEINRYRPGQVIVLDRALGRKTISGRFHIARTEEILGWIERAAGATSRRLPGGIVLLS
jgi:transmembrane sensor